MSPETTTHHTMPHVVTLTVPSSTLTRVTWRARPDSLIVSSNGLSYVQWYAADQWVAIQATSLLSPELGVVACQDHDKQDTAIGLVKDSSGVLQVVPLSCSGNRTVATENADLWARAQAGTR